MIRKYLAAAAFAAAIALAPAAFAAKGGGGGGGGAPGGAAVHSAGPRDGAGPRVYGWSGSGPHPHGHGHGHHHRHGAVGIIIGDPYYDDDYGDDCAYLHERAVETGSRYWWRRYEECVD